MEWVCSFLAASRLLASMTCEPGVWGTVMGKVKFPVWGQTISTESDALQILTSSPGSQEPETFLSVARGALR